jgi:hypothetical protein
MKIFKKLCYSALRNPCSEWKNIDLSIFVLISEVLDCYVIKYFEAKKLNGSCCCYFLNSLLRHFNLCHHS